MTKGSDKNIKKKSDGEHNTAGKRFKKDNENTSQIVEFQKENNQTILNDNVVDYKQQINVNNGQSCLEILPSELVLLVMSYLSSPDVVLTFYGLNQRYNSIAIEHVRHFKLPNITPLTWFAEYLPRIESKIETLSLNVKFFSRVFPCASSYPNIRSITLEQSNCYTIELNVERDSALNVVISSLSILQLCSIQITDDVRQLLVFPSSQIQLIEHDQANVVFQALACSAIKCLSIADCNEQDLLCLCALSPNLTNLRVMQLRPGHNNFYYTDIAAFISQPTRLTQLNITADATGSDTMYLNSIERLIECYQSSLEQLTLLISCSQLVIDGRRLEALLQPCAHLKKLNFAFQFEGEEFDAVEQFRQFKSNWWLNSRQPPVLIQRNDYGDIFIGSMPCILPVSFSWSTNLDMWGLNKEQLNSPLIYFTRVKSLHFLNKKDRPVTLDFLYFIDRVFRSCYQELRLKHWGLTSPHILFEQLISASKNTPVLPKVKCLDISSSDRDGLDAMTLLVWLQLAPNVRQLILKDVNNTAKMRLGKQLSEILNLDARVNAILARLDKISVS